MSRPIAEEITCPVCKRVKRFTRWSSLNVTLNPAEKPKLLDGSLTRFTCECGHSAEVVYPLLYHDMVEGLLIWMIPSPDGQTPQAPKESVSNQAFAKGKVPYRFRLVGSKNELVEKISIFAAGLDDRLIELAKLLAESQLPEKERGVTQMYFNTVTGEGEAAMLHFVVLAPSGRSGIKLSRDAMFRTLSTSFPGAFAVQPPAEWPRIDRQYAVSMISGGANAKSNVSSGIQAARPANRPWWRLWN